MYTALDFTTLGIYYIYYPQYWYLFGEHTEDTWHI